VRPEFTWILVTAFLWGGYPLVSRTAGFQGPRAALILTMVGLLPISLMAFLDTQAGWPTRAGLGKLAAAGLMMGGGLVAFVRVAAGPLEASVALPIVDVAMLLVSAIGAMLMFAEPLTWQKGVGIALLLGGIALLRPA
jgi:drug/metabolite transporter (DMT)-like permease